MDTIRSFKGYGKVDPAEEAAFRRKTRKRIIIVFVSLVLLVAVIIGAVTHAVIHNFDKDKDSSSQVPSSQLSPAEAIKVICNETQYPESCYSSLSEADKSNTTDPEELFKLSLQVTLDSLSQLSSLPETLMKSTSGTALKDALRICETVLNDAIDYVNDSISSMDADNGEKLLTPSKIEDLRTWLSSVLTNQETCLDTLEETDLTLLVQVKSEMQKSTLYATNSLAIVSKILGILDKFNKPVHRKLLGEEMESVFPRWVRPGVRKLLQAAEKPTPNVTVAVDGTGNVTTINEAMAMVPKKSNTRFVIYIKEGVYKENITLDSSFWNVMVYGDGKDKSIVCASLNKKIDGLRTYDTATFAVTGRGFIAMDMGFKNAAGPTKHQAVALRSNSDLSVFYRCSFDGYQDTLYSHSNRQFYRECDITGTIDFIFGNAAAVYQNCKIMPRQPLATQSVVITAQGKDCSYQNTGFSIQNCDITPLDNNLTAPTYLGRPWKNFSRTVIMQSSIGGFLNPLGWQEMVKGVEPPGTIFYGEYMNSGPGADIEKRVKWAGYHPNLTRDEASSFTVESLIHGSLWLPATNVMFDSTL